MYRIDIGARVRGRLESVAEIKRVPSPAVDMFLLRGFLSERECEALIAMIERDRKPSQLLSSDNPDANFRTSETCLLDGNDPVVRDVEARLTDLLGIEPQHGEALQGQRYAVGQQFKPHHDYLRTTEAYWAKQERVGGSADLDGDGFSERARGGRRDVLSPDRREDTTPGGEPGHMEQPRRQWASRTPIPCIRECRSWPARSTSSPSGIASGRGGWKARRTGPRWATAFRAAARCLRAELPMSKAETGGLDP